MPKDIEEIRVRVLPILKRAGVKRSEVFGSFARGEFEPNDIDMLVEMPIEASLLDFAKLKDELEESLEAKVDLVSYDALKPELLPYIEKDKQSLL